MGATALVHRVAFVREMFGVVPDPWQVEVLEAFPQQAAAGDEGLQGAGQDGGRGVARLELPG